MDKTRRNLGKRREKREKKIEQKPYNTSDSFFSSAFTFNYKIYVMTNTT